MIDINSFMKSFFINISMMMALMYIGSLLYKYFIYKLGSQWKEALFVILAIACGWITMKYGFRFSGSVIFDLRYLAVIVAPLFVRKQITVVIIGLGIGLARLSFGMNTAAVVGCLNVIVMSLLCVLIMGLARRYHWGFNRKMATIILTINIGNNLFIAMFGVIPRRHYLTDIAPATFLLSLLMSIAFTYLIREFMMEAGRKQKLQIYAARLEKQYRISEGKSASLELAKQELEQKNRQVESASRYKTEFLANMSHELRTPLNSVLVLAQILEDNEDGNLSDAEAGYARIIRHSGKELLGLINDVLDLSKIEAGKMELDRSEISVSGLLAHMEDLFRLIAAQKRVSLKIVKERDVPEILFTDGQRLQQIVKNLLSNALKFTQKGEVKFTISVVDEGALLEKGGIAFSVEDTGIGIAEDKRAAIFEAFFQADGTITRAYGGTGLGLSIAKQFAVLLGGDIYLESTEGIGSRFVLYLPWKQVLAEGESYQPVAEETKMDRQQPVGSLSTSRGWSEELVLIVDDDENNVYSLRAALEGKGVTVITASSGSEALAVLAVNPLVSMVLMDIMMPGMNGLEAIRRIRLMPGLADLPIIAVTSKAFAEDRAECLAAGAADYLSKPLDVRELMKRMTHLLQHEVREQQR